MKNENLCTEIVQDIETGFINFPHVKRILTTLDRLRERQCGKGMAKHIVLLGESGVGKSTLLTRYVEKHPRIVHEELTEVPVLFAEIDQSPNPKRMAGTLLEALGDPKWDVGKEEHLTARFVLLMKRCRVRLVLLDEANHLIDRGGEKTLHTSGDWIKRVANKTRVPFVLAGIPRTKRLFATNDQVRGRFREIITIDRFSLANKSAEHEFRSVLKAFKGYLRELPTIDLSGVAITRQFAFATDGRLREIQSLLARAVELAYEQPDPRLTVAVLAEAFRTVIYPGSPDKRNPFHKAFDEMPLVKGDEPFAPVER
ncbi:DNA transposition AAA+ family ATPase [Paraburkholderia terricola]|uniref:TniB family NTP-binding protein n=1 Tax=Paraburkholderia terricola TaxID=169427 RepID=UPI002858D698|nr:TniB family NTP-binding protein [Paraburkholderia terricola]MDR6496396.1 DNA transposition AAA+ family ATPase [Paraburkholderia terricola]